MAIVVRSETAGMSGASLSPPLPAKQGLVVRKEWVMDSYVKKKRLPARK